MQLTAPLDFSAAYCGVKDTWSCGASCNRVPGVTVIASGGDGELVPNWYVAWSSVEASLIVAHRGTNTNSIISILSDLAFVPAPLSQSLFPGSASKGILAHSGFSAVHALTAEKILAAVKSGMKTYSTSKVVTVGHSLGGALSVLDAIYFKLNLPPSTTIINRAFGLPRVGNAALSTFVSTSIDHSHATNFKDPVPHLPLLAMGFQHPTGEWWISSSSGSPILSCAGKENLRCGLSKVFVDADDHCGPYNGVAMCTTAC